MLSERVVTMSLPGGRSSVVSGGTRNEINLNRPWQRSLRSLPKKCPFCGERKKEMEMILGIPTGWCILPDLFTLHEHHSLIIPDQCWRPSELQTLGGSAKIAEALQTVRLVTENTDMEMAAFVHIGQSAGQNVRHLHWHIMKAHPTVPFQPEDLPTGLRILSGGTLECYAMGARAGECLIVPKDKKIDMDFNRGVADCLANVIFWLVDLGNKKFCSVQGLAPNFTVTVRLSREGFFLYADYCPILNTWGASQYVLAPLEGEPIPLAWPHEVTARYLCS